MRSRECIGPRLVALLFLALLSPPTLAGKGGKGGGGNGGGGGGSADPAIAFLGNGQLGVMDEDGSNVTNLGLSGANHPDWSPDLDGDPSNGFQGSLAFELALGDGTTDVHLADIRVVNGVPTALAVRRLPVPESFEASWSPDLDPATPGYQGRIAFADSLGIGAVAVAWDGDPLNPSTQEDTEVLRLATWDNTDQALLYDPVWSNDGTRLIYGAIHYDFTISLRVIDDLSTPTARIVLQDPALAPNQMDWSHGSSEVVFASGGVLYTLDVDVPGSLGATGLLGNSPSYAPGDARWALENQAGRDLGIYVHDRSTNQTTLLLQQKRTTFQLPDWRPE